MLISVYWLLLSNHYFKRQEGTEPLNVYIYIA